ncbi:MAG TPA: hypothetical protein VG389_04720, partial [Myxococcota bacterium]|nr:hypothetical protein [Myxococcota bacterium]
MPQCGDGVDNDGDALIDFPADPGCVDPLDDDEVEPPQCSDGLDNDADGLVDLDDPGCTDAADDSEVNPECSDGIDNDGDGLVDFPADPQCGSALDPRESVDPVCDDGLDNDGDGLTDYPDDPGCDNADDPSESDIPDCGGLEPVVDVSATGMLSGTTDAADASLFTGTCGGGGAEAIAHLDVPALLTLLSVDVFGTTFPNALYIRTDCGTATSEVGCAQSPDNTLVELGDVAPGEYFLFVDGNGAADAGPWYLHVFGIIATGEPCTPGDMVFRCDSAAGMTCTAPLPGGPTVCNAGACSDGIDNDGDAVTDFPFDCGCTDAMDADETDPPVAAQCCNGTDDDGDGAIDFPADPGCGFAADDLEENVCIPGVPLLTLGPDGSDVGSTAGISNFEGTCTTGFLPSGPEAVYVFTVPSMADVHATTVFPATTMDTALYVRTTCDVATSELGCNDNDPLAPSSSGSTLDFPALAAGTYYLFVDG